VAGGPLYQSFSVLEREFTAMFAQGIYSATILGALAAAGVASAQEAPYYISGDTQKINPQVIDQPPARQPQAPVVHSVPHVALLQDPAAQQTQGSTSQLADPQGGAGASYPAAPPRPPAPPKKKKGNPVATSHKGVFYDNQFNYLDDPTNTASGLGDGLKRMNVGPNGEFGKLDIGGQYRMRYHSERGMNKGAQRFINNSDDFLLSRLRLYANYEATDYLRFYAEGITADSFGHNQPLRGIDRNSGDFLNAFVDVQLTDDLGVRVGRQELLYGAQRTVSPLDWANTRRTFEGVKAMWTPGDWKIDAFLTNPVTINRHARDQANYDQQFYGTYATYGGIDNLTFDAYYLGFDNQIAGFSLHTFGSRILGSHGDWLYEIEGAYQGGDAAGAGIDQDAGFATAGIGRKLPALPWSPTAWVYFDYASGDHAGGDFNGYNQLFPLAHKYLGFIDAVQRSNVESVNFLLTCAPTEKTKLLLWYYMFQSNSAAPVPSIGGTPNQNTGKDLGQELDIVLSYKICPRSDILFGYSHFWTGNKILNPRDADFFYCQWQTNF